MGNSWNRSHVPAHAQSCAELESPRALLPYMARWELSPATVLRLRAHAKYRTRSLAAYGRRLLEPERLVHTPTGAVTVTGWCQLRVASSFLL